MIRAAVIGATGYTGVEVADILLKNPKVKIVSLTGLVEKEEAFSDIFPRYKGSLDIPCKNLDIEEVCALCDVAFLALPHTVSMNVAPALLKAGKKVIDLSADYRLPLNVFQEWYSPEHAHPEGISEAVYGLPELNREKLKKARLVANPGCYPTSVILGLKPISPLLPNPASTIIVDSKTGTTGAGRKGSLALSFSEIDGNFKSYKAISHQHAPEMEHILSACAGGKVNLNFVPHLLPVKRGILSTIYVTGLKKSREQLMSIYEETYRDEPFVRVREDMPQLSDVSGTNFCDIGLVSKGEVTVIISVIDNLLKGASGQAVQNMNIMFSIEETLGLV